MVRRAALLLLAGCAVAPEGPPVAPPFDAAAVLVRASIDLRGRLPTEAELVAVEVDPEALPGLLDGFVQDRRFGARVADLFAPGTRTRVDQLAYDGQVALADQVSLGDEPLQVIARIANEDLPYTEVVTGDWTMADERLARVWPVDYPEGATGWQVARYTDGRPHAGILSGNALWWRHRSTAENYNRGRANALTRLLLCTDFLARPVHFERTTDIFDAEALRVETRENPACANCHSSLDPIGSYLYGFWTYSEVAERGTYSFGAEPLWRSGTGMPPSFFGAPGYTLPDLGAQIAGDPRFVTCAVETSWSGLLRRPAAPSDLNRLTTHREAFLDGGLTLRALVRSIVNDPAYRAVGEADHADNLKLMTPRTLALVLEDLTGFRWTWEDLGMLDNDLVGLRALGGGADGREITAEATRPTAPSLLVLERVAEMAALWAVAHDAERPEAARLFPSGTAIDAATAEADAIATVQHLFRRALARSVAADGQEVELSLRLWADARALEGDPERAWAVVLAWILRDPDFATY